MIPVGKKVAVALSIDFDAMAIWDGSFHMLTPAYMARGEFGAEVGAQRLLKLFEKHQVRTTWCIPGHTVDTFPEACREVLAAGHEIAHHGYAHENPTEIDKETERQVLQRGIAALERIGVKPHGYRSPFWDFSPNTLDLLEELGFEWDSSLMANDLHPYYPRRVTRPSTVQHGNNQVADMASVFGEPSPVLEIPPSWYQTDFPIEEYIAGVQHGMYPVAHLEERWRAGFDYAANEEEEGCCYTLTIHPQTSGRAHMIQMLDGLFAHMKAHGAAFMTLSEIADATEIQPRSGAMAATTTP